MPSVTELAYYIDTSALVKLVVAEDETKALQAWFTHTDGMSVSSDLTRTELLRAVRRSTPDRTVRARQLLDSLVLIKVATDTFEAAGLLDPGVLRTLDAIHLAVALDLGDELEGMVTYDDRLAQAASDHGIPVVAPS